MIGIYALENTVNGKIYIGQSIDIDKRIKEHFYKANNKNDISYNSAIHAAIRKYGKESFNCFVVEQCGLDELDNKEKYYINYYNSTTPNGYNILSGGQRSRRKLLNDSARPQCIFCGKDVKKYYNLGLCKECYKKVQCERVPKMEDLRKILIEMNGNFTEVGKHYNVSDNAVKKWCKKYNMSHYSKDYKNADMV